MSKTLSRVPRVMARLGLSRSTTYSQIADGLLPPPVRIGPRCVAIPDDEIDSVVSARIAGQDDDQIRDLVTKLVEARRSAV